MKSVSAEFKEIWARKYGRKEVMRVLYLRAYWNGSAYVYETPATVSGWNELEQSRTPAVRTIKWSLDTAQLNEFKGANMTLSLEDIERKWLPASASPSLFAPDSVASVGYEPQLTKFQVQFGYILDDGTKEYTALFTGFADDFRFDGIDATAEITVVGYDRLLRAADAQQVSDAFTLENCSPATGDGSRTEFLTTSVGVGRIDVVQVNGVTMVQGTDYNVSQLSETGAAKISFSVAPGNTLTVKTTGIKWKANNSIETLIGLLCDEAGIGSGARTIDGVVFPGGVSSSKTIDTAADWVAGSRTNVEYLSASGSIGKQWFEIDRFADGDFTDSPTWDVNSGTGITAASGKLVLGGNSTNGRLISLSNPKQTGTWEQKVTHVAGAPFPMFVIPFGVGLADGYGFYVLQSGSNVIGLCDGGRNALGSGSSILPDDNSEHTVRISLSADGTLNLYLDGVLIATFTVPAPPLVTKYFVYNSNPSALTGDCIKLDDIYYAASIEPSEAVSSASAVWVSAEQDLLAAPVSWGLLDRFETLNGGTIVYETAVSNSSGAGYDAYVAVSANGQINSALKRYLKIRVTFTPADASAYPYTSPFVDKLVAHYATTSVFVAVANFTSKNCYEAISWLASKCNYEWGFTGSGLFFFRSKNVSGDAVIVLNQENAIASMSGYRLGYDKIINQGRVRYGVDQQYESSYGSVDAGETSPTSQDRFGVRLKDETDDLLLANDATLAVARARLLYEQGYLPKKEFSLDCRMIPHVDLSDIASVTYLNRARDYTSQMSDPLKPWGEASFGPPVNVLARDMRSKIVGITYQFPQTERDGFRARLDCQEILS